MKTVEFGGSEDEWPRWIGHSGARDHITNDPRVMFNLKNCEFDIIVGNQESTRCTKMDDLQVKLKDSTGNYKIVTVSNVMYVPSFVGNLFSISTARTKGAKIRFKDRSMQVQKGETVFELLPTNTNSCGFLFSIEAERVNLRSDSVLVAPMNNVKFGSEFIRVGEIGLVLLYIVLTIGWYSAYWQYSTRSCYARNTISNPTTRTTTITTA